MTLTKLDFGHELQSRKISKNKTNFDQEQTFSPKVSFVQKYLVIVFQVSVDKRTLFIYSDLWKGLRMVRSLDCLSVRALG